MKKKIILITERRADYTKLKPILLEIIKSKKLDYRLIVTGSHLSQDHGYTISEILKDKIKIHYKFSLISKKFDDSGGEMSRMIGKSIYNISKILEKEKPDLVLAGFDIGANFAASIIAAHMNIPLAHIEGGEKTGTIDEPLRHSISKFSNFHFTSHLDAKLRLEKMGENKNHIFVVGNTALDNIKSIEPISKSILSKKYNIDFSKKYIIVILHTVTSEIEQNILHLKKLIQVISELNLQSLWIYGNSDAGSKKIITFLKHSKLNQINSIPHDDYINLLKFSSGLVGNSSSGIIEAPFLKIPTLNIGTRQNNRLHSYSVIDSNFDKKNLKKAMQKILYDKNFQKNIRKQKNHYGNGNSAKKIVKILENLNLKNFSTQKIFID